MSDAVLIDRFLEMMAAERGAARNTLAAYRRDLEQAAELVRGALGDADASEAIEASATAVAAKNAAVASANNAAASATAAESAQGSIGNLALIHSLTIGMMRRF